MFLKFAFKKWYLQFLQFKATDKQLNKTRYYEQLNVLLKLSQPNILFTKSFVDESLEYAKYINLITSKAMDDRKYQRAVRHLKECQKA